MKKLLSLLLAGAIFLAGGTVWAKGENKEKKEHGKKPVTVAEDILPAPSEEAAMAVVPDESAETEDADNAATEEHKKQTIGKGIAKEELRERRDAFLAFHREIKDRIKAEREMYRDMDPEARKEIRSDFAAAKKELRERTVGAWMRNANDQTVMTEDAE